MRIGSIGEVAFKVSDNDLFTFYGLTRAKSASFAEHKVLRGQPKTQFTGAGLDAVSFNVLLESMVNESVSVDRRIKLLLDMVAAGEEVPLVFGGRYWGLWSINSAGVEYRHIHNGITLSARISLDLKEYH